MSQAFNHYKNKYRSNKFHKTGLLLQNWIKSNEKCIISTKCNRSLWWNVSVIHLFFKNNLKYFIFMFFISFVFSNAFVWKTRGHDEQIFMIIMYIIKYTFIETYSFDNYFYELKKKGWLVQNIDTRGLESYILEGTQNL